MSLNHLSDTTKPTLYLNPNVNNLTCVTLNSGSGGQTSTGNITINPPGSYLAIPSGGSVSVFGTPPTGYYGITTTPSAMSYVVGSNTSAFHHKFYGGSITDPVLLDLQCSTGTATFGGSLLLPTTGGTPSNLNYYEEFTFTTTYRYGGGAILPNVSSSIVRIGNIVTFRFPNLQIAAANATGSITGDTALPSRFRPATTTDLVIAGTDNGSLIPIFIEINSITGILTIKPLNSAGAFGGGLSTGPQSSGVSYSLLT